MLIVGYCCCLLLLVWCYLDFVHKGIVEDLNFGGKHLNFGDRNFDGVNFGDWGG